MADPFDPTTWSLDQHLVVFALHEGELIPFVVDVEDAWVYNYMWGCTKSRSGKLYASRTTTERGTRRRLKFYMHREIMEKMKCPRKSRTRKIVDHEDGDEGNCRRANLRWVTKHENRHNREDYKNGKQ